jgi:hypothetical protein
LASPVQSIKLAPLLKSKFIRRLEVPSAYRGLAHPTFFTFEAAWAGIEQATNTPDYRQEAKGYGDRFGAGLASGVSEGLFANAILPSLLHQDPRYYYQVLSSAWPQSLSWAT